MFKWESLSMRLRFTLVFLGMLLVISSIVSYGIYQRTKTLVEREVGLRAMGIAQSIAEFIDTEEHKKIAELVAKSQDRTNPLYQKYIPKFQQIAKANNAIYIYTETVQPSGKNMFIFNYSLKKGGKKEDYWQVSQKMRQDAYSKSIPVYSPLLEDPQWNAFVTGYAPIINEKGEVEALVGVDLAASEVTQRLSEMETIITLTLITFVLIGGAVSFKIGNILAMPALTDGLTSLYNHKYFHERVSEEIERSNRYGHDLSLILFDIDHFKNVNDTYGHQTGDIILKELAALVQKLMRQTDCLARYGGEEFAIILPHTNPYHASLMASRIREAVDAYLFLDVNGRKIHATISLGVAQLAHGEGALQLINHADRALYKAKASGRNRVELYTPMDKG